MSFRPTKSSLYVMKEINKLTIDTTKQETYVLPTAVLVRGHVTYPSGLEYHNEPSRVGVASYDPNDFGLMELSEGYYDRSEANLTTGNYSLKMPLSTSVKVTASYEYDRGRGNKSVIFSSLTSDKIPDIVISGGMWNGKVVNVDGAPLQGISIRAESVQNRFLTSNDVSSSTGVDGTFSVFCTEENPYNIILRPPYGDSNYLKTTINYVPIDTTKEATYVLSVAVIVSGKITFPTGLVPRFMRVSSYDDSNGVTPPLSKRNEPVFANDGVVNVTTGNYSLKIPGSTNVTISVYVNYDGGSGSIAVGNLTITSDKVLNLTIPGGMWSGTVVNTDDAPVGSVDICGGSYTHGKVYSPFINDPFTHSYNEIYGVRTGVDGTFGVFCMELNPYRMILTPPMETIYLEKIIVNVQIETTKPSTWFILLSKQPTAKPTMMPSVGLNFMHAYMQLNIC